eukprot:gene20547-40352_t
MTGWVTRAPNVSLHLRTFDGGNAISDFKVQQLLPRLAALSDKITGLSARFVHLAAFDGEPTAATVALTDNRIAGDALSLTGGVAAFADKNAGSGKAVSVSGIVLSGADAGNYTFTGGS